VQKLRALKAANVKPIIGWALNKLTENLGEMAMTIVAATFTISYIAIVAPLAAQIYTGYIVAIFLLLQLHRLVQDFDEGWNAHEIGELLMKMDEEIKGIYRMVRDETILTADADDSRLEAIINS